MKTQKLLFLLMLIGSFALAQQNQISVCKIRFEKNSDRISPGYRAVLDSFSKIILPGEELGITGFSDSDGDEALNNKVSLRRANAVKNYLKSRGLINKIHLDHKGELCALNENKDENEKALNRRVDILHDYAKYNDVLNSFKKNQQVYMIFPKRDTIIACQEGLTLYLKAGIFETESNELIQIKVEEFNSKSDFILAGLNSQGPGNTLLESGGMANIEAWQSEKKLELKPGESAGVLFKNRAVNDNMQLFNAVNLSEVMEWLPANTTKKHSKEEHTLKTKELMSVRYSVYDTSFVYTHYWEEGPNKITKNTIKGKTSLDTITDETAQQAAMIFGASKLGWINCDRFYNSRVPKTFFAADYPTNMQPFVSIVFKDMNSIMSANGSAENRAIFNDIPEGKEILVVAMYKKKDSDKILFAMQPAETGKDKYVKLSFESLDAEQVKERLKSL